MDIEFEVLPELFKVKSLEGVEVEYSGIKVGDLVGVNRIEFNHNGEILFNIVKSKNGKEDYFHLDELKIMMGICS